MTATVGVRPPAGVRVFQAMTWLQAPLLLFAALLATGMAATDTDIGALFLIPLALAYGLGGLALLASGVGVTGRRRWGHQVAVVTTVLAGLAGWLMPFLAIFVWPFQAGLLVAASRASVKAWFAPRAPA